MTYRSKPRKCYKLSGEKDNEIIGKSSSGILLIVYTPRCYFLKITRVPVGGIGTKKLKSVQRHYSFTGIYF